MSAVSCHKWSSEKANAWWTNRPWVCGFNFLPSTAVNFLEMWLAGSFDQVTIARGLGWASKTGYNAVRINLHYLVWKHDREGLIDRLEWFLETAYRNGIDTVIVPFDDCGFGGLEPYYGPQKDPIANVHNSRAVASPGRAAVMERDLWPDFESYLRDIIRQFRTDQRILFWDLYNEPGNRMIFTPTGFEEADPAFSNFSCDLMRNCFEWARSEGPVHPLTVGAWRTPQQGSDTEPFDNEIDQIALERSDIVTFHGYCSREMAASLIDHLAVLGRPILITEWMARAVDSRIRDQLALFHSRKIGCFNWGLVKGRTQTHLPWPKDLVSQHGTPSAEDLWFHDIFHPDGTAYDTEETRLLRQLTQTQTNSSAAE